MDPAEALRASFGHDVPYCSQFPVDGGELEGTKGPKGQRDAALALAKRTLAVLYMLCKSTSQYPRGRRPSRRGAVVRLA